MNMNQWLLLITMSLFLGANVQALDKVDILIGGYVWNTAYTGDFTTINYKIDAAGNRITLFEPTDVRDDLGMQREVQQSIYFILKHNHNNLPHLRLAHSSMQAKSSTILTTSFYFQGVEFSGRFDNVTAEVESEVDLTHSDISGFYTRNYDAFSLDIGLTLRNFDGFVEMRQPLLNATSRLKINQTAPLLLVRLNYPLTIKGLSTEAETHLIQYNGDRVIDFNTFIRYELGRGSGMALGYRLIDIDLTDLQKQDADLRADGPYMELSYHF